MSCGAIVEIGRGLQNLICAIPLNFDLQILNLLLIILLQLLYLIILELLQTEYPLTEILDVLAQILDVHLRPLI